MTSWTIWIGVVLGALTALRVIRLWVGLIIAVGSVILGLGILYSAGNGVPSGLYWGSFLLYGPGLLLSTLLPAGVVFGIVTLFRCTCLPLSQKRRRPAVNPRSALFWGAGLGLIYLVYAIGLASISEGNERSIMLRASCPNVPAMWVMDLFGFDEGIKTATQLEAVYFTVVGTILYGVMGGVAGYAYDFIHNRVSGSEVK